MEMVMSQYEVLHVAEPIRLPFESFDLVVESFGHGIDDAVFEVYCERISLGLLHHGV
jgi:hypothetical protein